MNTVLAVTFWMLIGGKFGNGLNATNSGDIGLLIFKTKTECEYAAQAVMNRHPDDRAVCVEGTLPASQHGGQ